MAAKGQQSPAGTAVIAYVFLVALLMYFTIGDLFLRHHDLGWHLAAGDLIRTTGEIPKTDPWSFTANGYPWLNIAWLWDVIASWLYEQGEFAALIAMTALLGAAVCALLAQTCLRHGGGIVLTVVGTLWVAATLPIYEQPLDFVLAAAPQSVSLLFFMAFWYLLDTAYRSGSVKKLWPLPLIMVAWINMHGGFLLAFVLIAAYAAEAWYRRHTLWIKRLFILGVISAAAILVNPLGIEVITGTLRTLGSMAKASMSEWLPFTFGRDPSSSLYFLVAVICIRWLNAATPLATRLLALSFLVLGLCQQRHFSYFMLTSLPLLAVGLHQCWMRKIRYRALEERCQTDCAPPRVQKQAIIMAVVALIALWPASAMRWPSGTGFPADIAPTEEIVYIAKHFPGERIYNHWNLGGFLIFHTRGAVKVMIDGRAGTAYPPEALLPTIEFNREREVVERYDLRVALMPRYIPNQLSYFEASPDWKLAFSGKVANVYIRR